MVRWLEVVALAGALAVSQSLEAQVASRAELGVGLRLGGISPGPSIHAAGAVSVGRWGGRARIMLSTGKQTTEGGLFGPRKEVLDEVAVLVTRGHDPTTPHRLSMGLGLGSIGGERRAVRTTLGHEDIPRSLGLAFALGVEMGDGRGAGGGFNMSGNLNREASYVSAGFFVSLAGIW